MLNLISALLLPLTLLAPVEATPSPSSTMLVLDHWYWAGSVRTTNTIDILGESNPDIRLDDGDEFEFVITADGNGSNTLTVKIQQQVGGTWQTVRDKQLQPGQQRSGSFVVADMSNSGATEDFRIRVSRKIGTKAIDYTVDLQEI